MKRKTTLLISLLLVGSLLLTTACGLTDTFVGKIMDKFRDIFAKDVNDDLNEDILPDLESDGEGSIEHETEDDGFDDIVIDDMEGFYGSRKIPKDFPQDFCPLYEPSELVGVQEYETETSHVYTIMVVTKDDKAKISEFYADVIPNTRSLEQGMIMFRSKDGTMTGSVQLSQPDEKYAAEGNKNAITLIVSVNKD
mgnify:FL=1